MNTNSYKFKLSYFPRTIDEWNHLPHHLLELESVDLFVIVTESLMYGISVIRTLGTRGGP